MKGIIFDIKEFALNDGDGIRTTVFFKGCPLRCIWCHNPEGLDPRPELYLKKNGCTGCGSCRRQCKHEECRPFGRCIKVCPSDLVTVAGKEWTADALADKLLRASGFLNSVGGGITLSGGEPLMQADFAYEILKRLSGKIHRAIETSGYTTLDIFKRVASECELVIMDLKLIDEEMHKKYTGVSNKLILENAKWLKSSGIKHIFRTPLIPGITDTDENMEAIKSFVCDSAHEFLPYNTLAGAKYESVGRRFTLDIKNAKPSSLE